MSDTYTEVSSQGWFSRVMESIKGIAVGVVLFVVAFPLLFMNEGCAVRNAKALSQGQSSVVSVSADEAKAANEGKLIHVTGEATTDETLEDATFSIATQALRLKREVLMYQWVEKESKEKKKELGGSETTVTTYTYDKQWVDKVIDSTKFKNGPDVHKNPTSMPWTSSTVNARRVTLGGFRLTDSQIQRLNGFNSLALTDETFAELPPNIKSKAVLADGKAIISSDPGKPANASEPRIGDVRVAFSVVRPLTISVVAQQLGDSFGPFPTAAGVPIDMLETSAKSAEQMFQEAKSANVARTWLVRLVGLIMMVAGVNLICAPLVVVADVIPMIGSFLQGGVFLLSIAVSLPFALITIAVAWIFYRPLIGVPLIIVAIGGMVWGGMTLLKRAKAKKAAAGGEPAGEAA